MSESNHQMDYPRHLEFQRLCREKQIAVTHQRLVLYHALMDMRDHPSPEQVFERVRPTLPSVSLATIYKTLRLFVDAGIICEVSPHHGSLRIDPNVERHHHFLCLECHSITDLEGCEVDLEPLQGSLPKDFQVQKISLEVQGLCGRCSGSNNTAGHA